MLLLNLDHSKYSILIIIDNFKIKNISKKPYLAIYNLNQLHFRTVKQLS